MLAPLLVFSLSAWRSWDRSIRSAEVEVSRTAEAAAEYARRLLEGQLLRVQRADDLLAGRSDAEILAQQLPLHKALAELTSERGPARLASFYLFVFDRGGEPLVASNVYPVLRPNPEVQNRSFNLALRPADAPFVHISEIYTGVSTTRPYFSVTARRTRSGNPRTEDGYEGVINAAVYLDQINPGLAALAAAEGDLISLVREDGMFLARSVGFEGRPDGARLQPNGTTQQALQTGARRGILTVNLPRNGGTNIVAFRQVDGDWPVFAMSARRLAAIRLGWLQAVLPQAVLAALSSLLLLLLALAVQRRQAALVGANAALEDRVRARTRDLRDRERLLLLAQQAAAAAAWSWEPTSGKVVLSEQFEQLFGHHPKGGDAASDLRGFMALVHPRDRGGIRRVVAAALRSGSMASEFRVRRPLPTGSFETVWLMCRARLYPASADQPGRMVGILMDITPRRLAEERQVLLLREVDHRAKNALAVVKAAVRLTPRHDANAFAAAVEGRIDALARAQSLLSETSWAGTPLRQVLEAALEPFKGSKDEPRLVIEEESGLVLEASAIQPLSMAIHELATNATKYGALSNRRGQVLVRCGMVGGMVRLAWAETGGPPVVAPGRRGFGSRVVEATIGSQLGGAVSWQWPTEGLRVALMLPIARVLRAPVGEAEPLVETLP